MSGTGTALRIAALTLAMAIPALGQTGEPLTQPAVGSPSPSPLVLDATRFNGSPDVCLQINNAVQQMNSMTTNNGVVDARAFTGNQKCATNMFPVDATGKLLLGNVVLNVSTTQIQPSKFQVEGTGWSITTTDTNTVMQACTGAGTYCPGALGGTTPTIWCWGSGVMGVATCGGGIQFGSLTQYVSFDCAGLSGCTAAQAYSTQEGSGCWHCQFRGWGNGGIGLDVCGGTSSCQNSSFLDLFASITNIPRRARPLARPGRLPST